MGIIIKKKRILFYKAKNVSKANRMRKFIVSFFKYCVVFVIIVVLKVNFPHA